MAIQFTLCITFFGVFLDFFLGGGTLLQSFTYQIKSYVLKTYETENQNEIEIATNIHNFTYKYA